MTSLVSITSLVFISAMVVLGLGQSNHPKVITLDSKLLDTHGKSDDTYGMAAKLKEEGVLNASEEDESTESSEEPTDKTEDPVSWRFKSIKPKETIADEATQRTGRGFLKALQSACGVLDSSVTTYTNAKNALEACTDHCSHALIRAMVCPNVKI